MYATRLFNEYVGAREVARERVDSSDARGNYSRDLTEKIRETESYVERLRRMNLDDYAERREDEYVPSAPGAKGSVDSKALAISMMMQPIRPTAYV